MKTGAEYREALQKLHPNIYYMGEKIVEYNGMRYGIYRTYIAGDDIELYLEEKGGIYVSND